MNFRFFAVAVLFFFPSFLFAQQTKALSDSLSKNEKSSYLKADINYLSNAVYNGRKDSLPVPYITPTIGYYHKSGLYAEGSMSLLTSSYAVRPDMFVVDGGYNFTVGDNFSGSVSASKYFFSKQSVSVRSEVRGTLDASAAYSISNIIKVNGTADYLLNSGKSDILTSLGISHEWAWGKDSDWSIEPAFTVNAGSQNYFDSYQQSRTTKTGKRKNTTSQAGVVTSVNITSLNPKRFTLLDYELSAPVYYDTKKWGAYLIPTFAIPKNPDTYSITTTTTRTNRDGTTIGTPTVKQFQQPEHIQNTFYAEVGVYFAFK